MDKLLTVSGDAKTIKGEQFGIMTGILYLAPHNVSGFQTCPSSSAGCRASCLYTAGRGVYQNVQKGRIRKTHMFFNERAKFFSILVQNIEAIVKKAAKLGVTPAIRLNGTSDIAWEKFKVIRNNVIYRNIFEAFADVQFYDYTKILGRKMALTIPNYSLTFSLSESNDAEAVQALADGFNVAVVIELGKNMKGAEKPKTWSGYPAINGDESDLRFNDPKGGHIILLHAKGAARKDTSGFVRRPGESFKTNRIGLALAA